MQSLSTVRMRFVTVVLWWLNGWSVDNNMDQKSYADLFITLGNINYYSPLLMICYRSLLLGLQYFIVDSHCL